MTINFLAPKLLQCQTDGVYDRREIDINDCKVGLNEALRTGAGVWKRSSFCDSRHRIDIIDAAKLSYG